MKQDESVPDISKLSFHQAFDIASKGTALSSMLSIQEELSLLDRALNNNDPDAQATLSDHYWMATRLCAQYPLASIKNAMWLANKAAQNENCLYGQFLFVFFKIAEHDPENYKPTPEMADRIKALADKGEVESSYLYAKWLLQGKGVEQDTGAGIEMLLKHIEHIETRPIKEQGYFLGQLLNMIEYQTIKPIHRLETKRHIPTSCFLPILQKIQKIPDITGILSGESNDSMKTFIELCGKATINTGALHHH